MVGSSAYTAGLAQTYERSIRFESLHERKRCLTKEPFAISCGVIQTISIRGEFHRAVRDGCSVVQ